MQSRQAFKLYKYMKRAQRIRLGIFIMISMALLLIMFGFFTARKLFEKRDLYYVAYTDVSVSGLEVGSPVKFMGINVGTIAEIFIDPKDVNSVIVKLSLRHDTPVKVDAVADIVSMGITGLKTIEIRGGSQDAAFLKVESFIQAGSSFTEEISGKAEVIAFKVEDILNNLQQFTHPDNMGKFAEAIEQITIMVDNTSKTFEAVNLLVRENRSDIRSVISSSKQFTGQLDSTALQLNAAVAKFNEIMQGDTLMQVLGNFRDISVTLKETNLNELIEGLAEATMQTQTLLLRLGQDIDRGGETLNENLTLLQHSLMNLNELSRKLNTNPSMLIRSPRVRGTPDMLLQQDRE